MPPAALIHCIPFVELSFDSTADVGGIEVEEIAGGSGGHEVVTRIMMLPKDPRSDEDPMLQKYVGNCDGISRYSYFNAGSSSKSLVRSFDSVDEIKEGSNEDRLIKTLARRATVVPYSLDSGLGEPTKRSEFEISAGYDDTDGKYLDILDQHLQETKSNVLAHADLADGPLEDYPRMRQAPVESILEQLVDSPCCRCEVGSQPLKSALRPSKYTSQPKQAISQASLVQFKDVDIREFKMTLGNHPSATTGPPVMMDWSKGSNPCVLKLDDYERGREPRRSRRQLKLSLQQRHNILVRERGFSFEEVKGAWQEALEVRKQRKETLERGLAMMKWDEVWESTCRKLNRLVDGNV